MVSITMSEEQFNNGLLILELNPDVVVTRKDTTTGHVQTQYVDADYEYREVGTSLVFINITKHNLYNFVTTDTIGLHFVHLLGDLKCPEIATSTSSSPAPKVPFVKPAIQNAPASTVPSSDSNNDSSISGAPSIEASSSSN